MKPILKPVALFKKADAVIQVCLFVTSGLACLFDRHGLVLYMLVMAACQVLSCLSWAIFFHNGMPRYAAGTFIRRVFLAVLLLFGITLFLAPMAFFLLAMVMLVLGPVLGALYFVITLKEIRFYSNARKPYYLL